MDFRVLGPLEVRRDGAPVRIGSRMQRRLLAVLLLHAGEDAVSAEQMIDVLWAGDPPPSAHSGLQTYVSRLRRLLGDGAQITSHGHGYRLCLQDDQLDAWRFEHSLAAARARLPDAPAGAATRIGEAMALWRGPAYAEFADEDFARAEAVRLDELRLAATEEAFGARLVCGDPHLVADLKGFVTAHPLRERPHALLMTALAQAGRQTEALEVFQRLRSRLADELGLEPSPALQQVQADILQQAPNTTTPTATHHGRQNDTEHRGNLPRPVTSLVGRRHETDAVRRLLNRGRLVTLTGVGGVGKTRLALQAAAAVAERYPDGVWWCELAPTDPDAIGHTVASVLGVQPQAHRRIDESIVSALAGKRLLLVLDNCEHVVAAAAQLVDDVVRRCPEVTVLTTSREPLAVDGEQVWRVPPLPLPPRGVDDGEATSAQLFYDRAASHDADFTADEATATAVADICRQLDGLPLAIELAAALVPALEPTEIARRLGDRFGLLVHGSRTDPRHRTLAAVVDWSHRLLDADQRRLFDRLAVFAGGFTLTAVEGVCADRDLPAQRIGGLLAGLVRRSMVGVDRSTTPARYHLLETLRQYAGQRLAERGEEPALQARHAAWFVKLAEHADTAVRGPGEAEAVTLLEAELANLRIAHRWAIEHDDADLALRLAAALYVFSFWRLRDEMLVWAEEAAALPAADGHVLHPTVWGVVAHGLTNRGELARARELAEQALAATPQDPELDRFAALHTLAVTALYEGRLADCHHHTQQASEWAHHHGDAYARIAARMEGILAFVYGGQREAGLAAALRQRRAADALGSPNLQAWTRYAHAEALGDDDPDTALELLEEALTLAESVRGRLLEGVLRVAAISLRARHHSPREALAAFPDVIAHWRRLGDWTHQWPTLRNLVLALVRLGADQPAAVLYGAQRAADTAPPVFGADAERLAEACATLASRLGPTGFHTLVEQGEQLHGAEAVDLALTSLADTLDAEPNGEARMTGRDDLQQPRGTH